ncbi:hypothetical protein JTE90_026540 [Oedothorax gibbosus]|uniref:Uncharacterized protein n=1 Tax=Oedothorax gibbosus TaxID=931172 RepID=A0AAV6VPR9_9ARAC|nr:hypothetical protein JTE90_026540 [Oedothorax gibbosus]
MPTHSCHGDSPTLQRALSWVDATKLSANLSGISLQKRNQMLKGMSLRIRHFYDDELEICLRASWIPWSI